MLLATAGGETSNKESSNKGRLQLPEHRFVFIIWAIMQTTHVHVHIHHCFLEQKLTTEG